MSTTIEDLQAMSRQELEDDLKRLRAELRRAMQKADDENRDLTAGEAERFDNVHAAVEARQVVLRDKIKEIAEHQARVNGPNSPLNAGQLGPWDSPNQSRSRNPWGTQVTDADTAAEVRSRALTAIERWDADDEIKESATQAVARAGGDMAPDASAQDIRGVAAHVVRYSDPLYISAFRKFVADPETYVADLTRDEAHAWRAAREEQRATLGTSGAVLPSPMDGSIVLTNNGAVDPMRELCRVDTTTSKSKRYITSAGSSFSYDAELAETSDDTFAEAEVEVVTHKGQGWIESSLEVWADQPDFTSEVVKIINDGRMRLDAAKFVSGSGTNEPFGIETSLAGTASEINAAGEVLAADDIYGLLEALPPRFRAGATWQMELSTANFIRRLYNPSGTEPALIEGDRMLGLPFRLNSSIDPYSAVDAAATATNRVLFVADWSRVVILDRVGTTVHFVPPGVLQNTNAGRPDGRVGWYATWRTGAKPLTIAAARCLDVETAA